VEEAEVAGIFGSESTPLPETSVTGRKPIGSGCFGGTEAARGESDMEPHGANPGRTPGPKGSDEEVVRHQRQAQLQDYVDGTLDDKVALRLHLDAQRIPDLQSDLDDFREFFGALDAAPRAEPGADFDRTVIESIPIEFYASAPRKPHRIMIFGDSEESVPMRSLGWIQRASIALLLADLCVVAFGRTPLATPFATVGRWIASGLHGLADFSRTTPVFDTVAASLATGYDAFHEFVSATATGQPSLMAPVILLALAASSTALRGVQRRRESFLAGTSH
jgi:hypothetical protein